MLATFYVDVEREISSAVMLADLNGFIRPNYVHLTLYASSPHLRAQNKHLLFSALGNKLAQGPELARHSARVSGLM